MLFNHSFPTAAGLGEIVRLHHPNMKPTQPPSSTVHQGDGTLVAWGGAAADECRRRPLRSVASVVLGARALAALLADGRVACFGDAEPDRGLDGIGWGLGSWKRADVTKRCVYDM